MLLSSLKKMMECEKKRKEKERKRKGDQKKRERKENKRNTIVKGKSCNFVICHVLVCWIRFLQERERERERKTEFIKI